MNLDSIGGQGLFGVYGGSILADGSTVEINNVDTLINKDNTFSASIKNLNSTLYIDAEYFYNYDKENSRGGGRLEHNGENAQTTIDGSFYNIGLNSGVQGREEAIVQVYNGKFNVTGDFINGKNDPYATSDYYGKGNLYVKQGAVMTIDGNFLSDSQGASSPTGISLVDLNNSSLVVKGKFDVYRSNIYLTEMAKIYTTDFYLDSSARLYFVGSNLGFGYINASSSATFNGSVSFKLTGSLLKNDDMSYLILDTPLLQGSTLREGKVTVLDSTGQTLTNYITEIVKK
ncbi:hypothetical protein, partial [Campylobacter avium]|uniref:hypothetical protein n=1 Tax=Campylobacter avium TaxID=522485 RepID=UPI00255C1249